MLTSVQMQMCMRMLVCVLAYLHATVINCEQLCMNKHMHLYACHHDAGRFQIIMIDNQQL